MGFGFLRGWSARRVWRGLASPAVLHYALPWLMVLLVVGTVGEKYVGLYEVQQRVFGAWVTWLGPLPLPGARLVLALLCVSLLARLAVHDFLSRGKVGIFLAHLGAFLLLGGGLVMSSLAVEGQLVLSPGQSAAAFDTARGPVPLPFNLTLEEAAQDVYVASDTARAYSARVSVSDGGVPREVLVEMNQPLRGRGVSVYLQDYRAQPVRVTFAVAENRLRVWPYVAGLVLSLGLLVTLAGRLKGARRSFLVALVMLAGSASGHAWDAAAAARALGEIPVAHEGRVKPLETFARAEYAQIAGHRAGGDAALAWLARTMFEPVGAMREPLFEVGNASVREALGLPERAGNTYSFEELLPGLARQRGAVEALRSRGGTLTGDQAALLAVYGRASAFDQLARSLTLVLPLDVGGREMTYIRLAREPRLPAPVRRQLEAVAAGSEQNALLRVIPPAGAGAGWQSPWEVYRSGGGAVILAEWQKLADAYLRRDAGAWGRSVHQLRELGGGDVALLKLELWSNRLRPLDVSWVFLALGFGLALAGLRWARWRRWAVAAVALGVAAGGVGLGVRMGILGRPPVGNLYESLLFAGWLLALAGLVLGRRGGVVLALGSLGGAALLGLSPVFAPGPDTLGVLPAVLNTRFWLATHVLAIMSAYVAGVLAALTAHAYLLARLLRRSREGAGRLFAAAHTAALAALALTVLGTVLGGIWADYSWGRFWGWDPKENGALLMALWLIWLLHGRVGGQLGPRGFAVALALLNVVIGLSWFGVNLLGTGLHSYGFTDRAALALGLFTLAELHFAVLCLYKLKARLHD